MKKRVLSAIVMLLIFVPIFLIGGRLFNLLFFALTLLGLREFIKIKENKYPDFIKLISYLSISLLYFSNTFVTDFAFHIDYKLLAGIFLIILLPVVLYHDEKIYNVNDAFYLLGGILFLGISMSLFNIYRELNPKILLLLFLTSIITDTYAYIVGNLIGKNKLLENISPNKTWEGTIGGSLVATFVCSIYYLTIINNNESIFKIGVIILFLSLVGQFGDLFFSAIKRTYKVKDFSNLIPGHGGILDRFDSLIFILLAFLFFVEVIL